ncbi:HAD hydrolase-like protein [Candidatus Gracilibacteria bacterium]|nr:HAD hydrolase-like protein [Candidatus Gracilibacteria bacterium]
MNTKGFDAFLGKHTDFQLKNVDTIGIDIDEVLSHFLEAYLEFYNLRNSTTFKRDDFFSYNFWEVTGGTRESAIDSVHDFFETHHFTSMSPFEGSQEAIKKLKEVYNLVIITSRQTAIEEETKKWLENHFPGFFKEIHFGNHFGKDGAKTSKSDICKKLGVKLLIEDSLGYALECSRENISTILLDSPWNQTKEILPSNIIRVKTWENILEILENPKINLSK